MPSEPGSTELRGLARSIHGLFSDEMAGRAPVSVDEDAGADGAGGDVAWVTEAAVRLPGDVEGPDPLVEAVTEYLRAAPEDRSGLLQAVRDSGVDARARRAGAAMADAAEALSRYSGEDPEVLEVARNLVNPGAASLLVGRILGAAGDKPRREELVGVLSRLGEEVEVAVLEALRQEATDPEAHLRLPPPLAADAALRADPPTGSPGPARRSARAALRRCSACPREDPRRRAPPPPRRLTPDLISDQG